MTPELRALRIAQAADIAAANPEPRAPYIVAALDRIAAELAADDAAQAAAAATAPTVIVPAPVVEPAPAAPAPAPASTYDPAPDLGALLTAALVKLDALAAQVAEVLARPAAPAAPAPATEPAPVA